MSHWREIQHIPDFNGKTVANIQFDGYEHFIIKFTDGTGAIMLADAEGNGPGWLEVVELVV